jgi:hypothetical protein
MTDYAANRAAWVAALRSGNYQQGREYLRLGDTFCCLGVGCAVMGMEPVHDTFDDTYGYDDEFSVAPKSFRDWVGLRTAAGEYTAQNGDSGSLTEDNDHHDLTFAQIADLIEAEPEGLFIND